ncbi:MAG: hypothetical protein GF364_19610 [Candidatus Lokiarchaeota archaeon]|nr:hypothetical protein [Candidatus Lokiarchaeota archaeon]
MAMTKKENQEISEFEKKEPKYRTIPRYTAWSEDEKIIVRVALPGVKREDIEMKALKDLFMLRATRDEILYSLDLELNVDIVPENTKTEYEEGLLRIELERYNPLQDAYNVPIQ